MTRQFKLAIVRARSDTAVPVIPDQVCLDVLMTGRVSVLRYWSDTTGGWLDFLDSAMMPWVDIAVPAADTSRDKQAELAFAALRAANPGFDPLAGFHGALVITHPGQVTVPNPQGAMPGQPPTIVVGFDGGSTVVGNLPTSVIPVLPSDHTFLCHELGHTLGFDHTFGLDNNGTDWDPNDGTNVLAPEYGSPYDLMSSASFGSRWLGRGPFWTSNPTFAGTTVPGWPAPGAFSMGPHMSRANLHRWFPDSLDPDHTVHRPLPGPGDVGRVRLFAPGTSGGTLLVLHPPGEPASGVGRVYVEYRDGRGWDRGLDVIGTDLAKVGLAVHTVADTAGGPRVWFRGSVPTGSVDTDLALAGQALVVTVDEIGGDGTVGWAEVSYRQSSGPSVTIRSVNFEEIVLGSVGPTTAQQTPCGDTITRGTWAVTTFVQYQVSTTGLGGSVGGAPPPAPVVRWTVGGVALVGDQGAVDVPFGDVVFPVDYQIDPVSFELSLSTASGGVRFDAEVVATVTVGGATLTASAVFRSRGFFEGHQPEDEAVLGRCLASIFDRANQRHVAPRFRIPIPRPPGFLVARWRESALVLLQELRLDPVTAAAVESLVLLQAPPEHDPAPDAAGQATTRLLALLAAGVDFSVPEADLTGWLANPEFTPYPALADALLSLLAGRALRQPAFIDVIAFNYEDTPGVPSPRDKADVDLDVLQSAVVEAFNIRNGTSMTTFESLVG